MAGAISTIIIDDSIELDYLIKEVAKTLNKISSSVENDDFFVVETKSINGTIDNTTPRPFIISIGEINHFEFEYSDEELKEIKNTINLNFKNSINISAMCNDKIDQRILGELTLFFSEKFNGIIDLFGVEPKLNIEYKWNTGNTTFVNSNYFKVWLNDKKFFMIK